MKKICFGALLILASLPQFAAAQGTNSSFDLNLNSDTVRGSFATRLSNANLQLGAGWLHHQDRGDIGHVGLHLVDAASSDGSNLIAGIGARLLYIEQDFSNSDGTALGIGGFFRYVFPDYDRISVGGHGYFAPDVVAFGDLTKFHEIEARISYNVLPEGDVYLGIRSARSNFQGSGKTSFNSGLLIGIQLRF